MEHKLYERISRQMIHALDPMRRHIQKLEVGERSDDGSRAIYSLIHEASIHCGLLYRLHMESLLGQIMNCLQSLPSWRLPPDSVRLTLYASRGVSQRQLQLHFEPEHNSWGICLGITPVSNSSPQLFSASNLPRICSNVACCSRSSSSAVGSSSTGFSGTFPSLPCKISPSTLSTSVSASSSSPSSN